MSLKQIERSSTAAFCPAANLLALGTVAGAVDVSFSTSARVELVEFDLASKGHDLPVRGAAVASERFHRLAWGRCGMATTTGASLGLLAGAMADGVVSVWDPVRLCDGAGERAEVAKLEKHVGPVKGLDWNPLSSNLLGTGGADGEVTIWDLSNPTAPTSYPAIKGAPKAAESEVTCLAFNHKVQHIFASSSAAGTTMVYDLKKQRPVISFSDPNGARRCSAMQWHPDLATQLIVASDDDRSPALQVWDLRNSISPLKEFVGHTKGVLAMSWCPADSGLLLTCGKDNRTLCWDTMTGEVVSELPPSDNWNFDVQWSPTVPGLCSTASFDGKVQLHNALGGGAGAAEDAFFGSAGEVKPARVPTRAPRWLRRPCGVCFGFGGKLVSFSETREQPPAAAGAPAAASGGGAPSTHSDIVLHSILPDDTDSLVSQAASFQAVVAEQNNEVLATYCDQKAAAAAAEDEGEVWKVLKIMLGDDARRNLLLHLNYEPIEPAPTAAEAEAAASEAAAAAAADPTEAYSRGMPNGGVPSADSLASDFGPQGADAESFFDNLAESPGVPPPQAEEDAAEEPSEMDEFEAESPSPHGSGPGHYKMPEADVAVQRALVVGDYEGAVKLCMRAKNFADALVLASIGSPELWTSTRDKYLKRHAHPSMRVVSALVSRNLTELVQSRPISGWRETLAMLATYADAEEWAPACDALAARLKANGDATAAALCFLCAGNMEELVRLWAAGVRSGPAGTRRLQEVVERAVILTRAAAAARAPSAAFAALAVRYAGLLVEGGQVQGAMDFLLTLPSSSATAASDDSGSSLAVLKDRIYQSSGSLAGYPAPPFPFVLEELQASATYQHQRQQPLAATGNSTSSSSNHHHQHHHQLHQHKPPTPQAHNPYAAQYTAPPSQYSAAPAPAPFTPAVNPQHHQPQHNPLHHQPPQQQQPAAAAVRTFTPAAPPPVAAPPAQQFAPAAPPPAMFSAAPVQAPAQPQFAAAAAAPTVPAMPKMQAAPPPVQQFAAAAPPVQQFAAAAPPTPQFTPAAAPPPASVVPPAGPPPGPPPGQFQPAAPPSARFNPSQAGPPPGRPPAAFMPPQGPPPGAVTAPPPGAAAAPAAERPLATHTDPRGDGAAAPPVKRAQPPAAVTVSSVDTSKVPTQLKPVVASLSALFQHCAAAAGPAKKREMDDNSRRLGGLFWRLNAGDISPSVADKLKQLCGALDRGDLAGATGIQVALTTSDWDECSSWLTALKRLLKARAALG